MITDQIELHDMIFFFNDNINHNFNKLKHKIFQEFKWVGAVAFLHACIVISTLIVAYCSLLVLR